MNVGNVRQDYKEKYPLVASSSWQKKKLSFDIQEKAMASLQWKNECPKAKPLLRKLMRIIAGKHKKKTLKIPASLRRQTERRTRPTTDRAKEMVFNILMHPKEASLHFIERNCVENMRILDAFAGTGSLGFEALSRGASHVTFFDQSPEALQLLHYHALQLKETTHCQIIQTSALSPPLASTPAGLIFLDPPYYKNLVLPALKSLVAHNWIRHQSVLLIEISTKETILFPPEIEIWQQRASGSSQFFFTFYNAPNA